MRNMPAEPPGAGEGPGTAERAVPPGAAEPAVAGAGNAGGAGDAAGAAPEPPDRPADASDADGTEGADGKDGQEPPGEGEAVPDSAAEEVGQAMLTGATYGVLFVLGVFLGIVGALEHSWYLTGGFPTVAIAWLAVLFAVPYAMARLMGTRLAAVMVAVGWGMISAVLAVHRAEGDLVIAGTLPGYVYLYGGMVAVAVAVVLAPSSSNGSWLLTPRFGAPPPDRDGGRPD
ncbi:hypothetical protein GCM10010106_32780 [Thermopolyspora flexuosa]|jgi:hypothetical protein|uniref:Integral membrane protein n=2 Tax=Thermopolyspora flexuosa TaxID=103836 RepID=A0A543IT12_9ACTN|nr:hypothetical protein FHX40_0373 [Thermopolyspora flexuosa]GGM83573.1 hypothetical protein GCM10010106_32780 [Thermopolyspora flexuosa]